MRKILGFLVLAGILSSGIFWLLTVQSSQPSPIPTVNLLLQALRKKDVAEVEALCTPRGFRYLSSITEDKEWRNMGLYQHAASWKLGNSSDSWEILKRWAELSGTRERGWGYPKYGHGDAEVYLVPSRKWQGSKLPKVAGMDAASTLPLMMKQNFLGQCKYDGSLNYFVK